MCHFLDHQYQLSDFAIIISSRYCTLTNIFQHHVSIKLKDIQEAVALFGDMELAATRSIVNCINITGVYTVGRIEDSPEQTLSYGNSNLVSHASKYTLTYLLCLHCILLSFCPYHYYAHARQLKFNEFRVITSLRIDHYNIHR